MEPSDDEEGNLVPRVEAAALSDCQTSGDSNGTSTSPTEILRIKDQMANQCFEMKAKLDAGKSKGLFSTSEAERDLPDYISELEDARTNHFNRSLALHRMQIWNAVAEKLMEDDYPEFGVLKVLNGRCMDFCSHIQTLQKESRELQDKITEVQKKRLELKRLTHEKMKEIDEQMNKEHPDMEKYTAVLEKGQSNLEKYKKMAIMSQEVVRGILLASKVNWMDDPTLRAITMTLEELPISD